MLSLASLLVRPIHTWHIGSHFGKTRVLHSTCPAARRCSQASRKESPSEEPLQSLCGATRSPPPACPLGKQSRRERNGSAATQGSGESLPPFDRGLLASGRRARMTRRGTLVL